MIYKYLHLVLLSFLLIGCAQIGSPSGGEKDTTPPKFIKSNLNKNAVNVPLSTKKIRLDFDEYITLKDIQKNITISPPIQYNKIIPTSAGNKYIEISWNEDLQPHTTYNFNFGNAIVDLNESNALPYFNFAFSTGEKIDSLFISGEIKSGFFPETEQKNEKNFIVGLYPYKDTIDYTKKPHYITKADADGYFEINHLGKGKYSLFAFEDTDQNSVFTPGKEEVYLNPQSIDFQESISGKNLKTFPSQKEVKFVEYKEISDGILLKFEGNPKIVQIQSDSTNLKNPIFFHKNFSDSAYIFLNNKELNLSKQNPNIGLKFSYIADELKGKISPFYKGSVSEEFSLKNINGKIPPTGVFFIESNKPLAKIIPEHWQIKMDSIKNQEFTAEISPENPYKIKISIPNFKTLQKYSLNIPKETLLTYGQENLAKNYILNFEFDDKKNYGSLEFRFEKKSEHFFWIELLNEQNEIKYSQKTNEKNIKFPIISPNKYKVRIKIDENNDQQWNPINFKKQIPAEPIYIYDKKLEIRPLWENIITDWQPFNP